MLCALCKVTLCKLTSLQHKQPHLVMTFRGSKSAAETSEYARKADSEQAPEGGGGGAGGEGGGH